ncbi:MAG: hypothetical protein WC058_02525 [Phycisphaeraceae bacterium]
MSEDAKPTEATDVSPATDESKTSTNVANTDPDVQKVEEGLQKLIRKNPKVGEMVSHMTASFMASGPLPNPVAKKITEEHISKALDLADRHDDRQFQFHNKKLDDEKTDRFSERKWNFAYFIGVIVLVMALVGVFRDKPEILIPVLTGVGGFVGGFVGGIGFGKSSGNKS